jgi:hypothetical protein
MKQEPSIIHGQASRRTDSQAATELFYARPPISHRDCRDFGPDPEDIDVYRRQGKILSTVIPEAIAA